MAVALAAVVLVPTTFAVGEPGTTLYASLGGNRFPSGSGASAQARLRFLDQNTISFDVTITGTPVRTWAARIYSRGSCNAVANWVVNRDPETHAVGYLHVTSNGIEKQELVTPRDVARIRAALARGERLAFMVAGTHPTTGASYRTCTLFGSTPPVTTTSVATTSASATQTNTTSSGITTGTTSLSSGTGTTSVTTATTSIPTGTSTLTTTTGTVSSATSSTTSSTFTSASLCFTYTDSGGFVTFTTTATTTVATTLTTSTTTTTSTGTGSQTTMTSSTFLTTTCFPANI